VGVHPNSSDSFDAQTPALLRELAANPKVVAVGEIGLDYHWQKVDPPQQRRALCAQLDLAAELGLPVIIHSREANDDVAAVLAEWVAGPAFAASPLAGRRLRGVLHAFSGDLDLAQAAYGWGFVLGLGGPVTYQNARALHALVPHLRLDRLMLETDAPYLAPHPHRGQRNEPAHVALICQQIARLCGMTPGEVAAATTATALSFFGLEELSGVENAPPLRSVQN
jgi:TatD DNase family protein